MKGLASFIYFDKHFNGKMVYALGLSDFIKYFPIGLINASFVVKKNVINGRENRRNIKYHHVKVLHVVFVVQ